MDTTTDVTELDALLETAGKRGFTWHMFRTDQNGPEVLAGVFQHSGCADVFVFSGGEHAHAYRMPTGRHAEVFAPTRVYWWYGTSPVWTLRVVLTLPHAAIEYLAHPARFVADCRALLTGDWWPGTAGPNPLRGRVEWLPYDDGEPRHGIQTRYLTFYCE